MGGPEVLLQLGFTQDKLMNHKLQSVIH